jgi:hypothetical protein
MHSFGIGARIILIFAAWLTPLWTTDVSANALPRQLVLQCEGDTNLVTTHGNENDIQRAPFQLALRLTDGSLHNIQYDFLEGKDCTLVDDVVRCELDTTTHNRELGTTSKEHRTVSINRATGEMKLMLESQTFAGTDTIGEPLIAIKSSRIGHCRSAATMPLF